MFVCICNALTTKSVRDVIEDGADTVGAVYRARDVTPKCGKCGDTIQDMINHHDLRCAAETDCDAETSE